MDRVLIFLEMGGYAIFVWSSYFIVAGVLLGFFNFSYRRLNRVRRKLGQSRKINDRDSLET